ncbi:hypothetical protein FOXYSP1_19843 [Fusarium oxysporum f. sp. phaseoli]
MATWQAAQWKHLEKLAGDNLDKLPFIPGILIQGHKWIFVASTFSNGKTVRHLTSQTIPWLTGYTDSIYWT